MLKQKLGLLFAALFIAASITWYWQTGTQTLAPNTVFKSIKGDTLALADLKGKPVLVSFWATDCPGCIEEIPHLIQLHQKFASGGLTIIAVAMHYDPPNHVMAMSEAKQLPYLVALDPSGEIAKAFGNVQLTPTSFLIDKNGVIVMHKVGPFDPVELNQKLENM